VCPLGQAIREHQVDLIALTKGLHGRGAIDRLGGKALVLEPLAQRVSHTF
jgi:hypothetical protein